MITAIEGVVFCRWNGVVRFVLTGRVGARVFTRDGGMWCFLVHEVFVFHTSSEVIVAGEIDFVAIAKGCSYPNVISVDNFRDLDTALKSAKLQNELSLIEVKCSIGARDNLGRPTTTALENKEKFMYCLSNLK